MRLVSQRRRFARWVQTLDNGEFRAASAPSAWAALTVFVVCLLAGMALVPKAREVFGVPIREAALCYLPALAAGLLFAQRHRGGRPLDSWSGLHILLTTVCLQFFVAALVALSQGPGATLLAAFLLFAAASHGRMYRVTAQQPFVAIGTLFAAALAALLADTGHNVVLLAIAGPAAAAAELWLGTMAATQDSMVAQTERLQAAVQAQLLKDQERDVDRLSEALREVLAYNHDIKQTLSTAASAAELLGVLARVGPRPTQGESISRQLQESLEHIQALVNDIRATGRKKVAGEPEAVSVAPLLDSIRTSVGFVFPDVDIQVDVDRTLPLAVWMRGGATSLRRVVDNLVTNACEGDGSRGATRVRIHARPDVTGARVELVITDDGPGFEATRLAEPIVGLSSSKPNGTGLGLYTAEALVRASGGLLERTNHHEGGAVLRVVLPRQLQ